MNKLKKLIVIALFPLLILTACSKPLSKPIDSTSLNTVTDDEQSVPEQSVSNDAVDNTLSDEDDNSSSDSDNTSDNDNTNDNDDNGDLTNALAETEDPLEDDVKNISTEQEDDEVAENDTTADSDTDLDTTVLANDNQSPQETTLFKLEEPPSENNNPNDNSKKSWWFTRNNTNTPPTAQMDMNLTSYDAYYLGDTSSKNMYLTFDNGYENGLTPKILDILKENDVKVAFFVVGTYIKSEPELIKRMVEEGHLVCNHSDKHPMFPDISNERIKSEIEDTAGYFKEVTGKEMPKYFRPPAGEYSQRTLQATKDLGYKTIFWSAAYKDWDVNDQPGADYAYKMVMDNAHNGSIVLLHSVSQSNVDALDDIIKDLKKEGYVFKTLDDYFKK